MPRLPQVGGDPGNWGDILNEYLSQSLAADGTLKTDVVGAAQLKSNSVTNAALASGTIQEAKLHADVQTKLNAPATVADGSISTAKLADGAVTNAKLSVLGIANGVASLDGNAKLPESQIPTRLGESELSATIGGIATPLDTAWAASDAFVDFTVQPDGTPATKLDTGQDVDYILQNVSNRQPVISGGKLKHGTLPESGAFANYYQAQLDGDIHLFGTRYVIDSTTGSTAGVMCVAVWAGIFEAAGTIPPRTPAHITINTVTNTWEWWVSDGLGTGNSNLKSIKQGTFTAPAKDGVAIGEIACLIDAANGIGYLLLPGADTATGKRIVTMTNAEIAAFLTAVSLTPRTFAYLLNGANVLMIEQFATTAANTAIYPEFLSVWGEVARPSRDSSRTLLDASTSAAGKNVVNNATSRTQALTASAVNITDGTNPCTIVATAGPTGAVEFEMEGTVLFTGAETVLGRMAGTPNTTNEPLAKLLGLATGETQRAVPVKHTWKLTGLTPGASGTWTLQMSAATSGGLASAIFGGAGAGYPPLVLKATPL